MTIMIVIFAEALGLYDLIVGLVVVMRSIIPAVMAGVLGLYRLTNAVILNGKMEANIYSAYSGHAHLRAGLTVGMSSLAAALAISIGGAHLGSHAPRRCRHGVGHGLAHEWCSQHCQRSPRSWPHMRHELLGSRPCHQKAKDYSAHSGYAHWGLAPQPACAHADGFRPIRGEASPQAPVQ